MILFSDIVRTGDRRWADCAPKTGNDCCKIVTLLTKSEPRSGVPRTWAVSSEKLDARKEAFPGRLPLLSLGSGVVEKHNINRGIRLWSIGLRFVDRREGFTIAVFDPAHDPDLLDETCGRRWKNLRLLRINEPSKGPLKDLDQFDRQLLGVIQYVLS